jgi:hypothetical protein
MIQEINIHRLQRYYFQGTQHVALSARAIYLEALHHYKATEALAILNALADGEELPKEVMEKFRLPTGAVEIVRGYKFVYKLP